ncbi:hypothetical protein L596_018330 [Steinernema carpocapsae]|uniref:PDZ domain-containing protein n=1 Tax=Steinernema carpocapsae TaxID=34508 RepID=A0A4V6A245_STECR|nr:hypothetical protein L596_018330 [Steinernema carpocapsae]
MTLPSEEKFSTEAASLQPPTKEEEDALAARLSSYTAREGFSCHFVNLHWKSGQKLGLHIKEYRKIVVVSRLDAGSQSFGRMCRGDRIVEVNGKPVTEMAAAKKQIVKSLHRTETAALFLERPETSEAKIWCRIALMKTSERGTATMPREKIEGMLNPAKVSNRRSNKSNKSNQSSNSD